MAYPTAPRMGDSPSRPYPGIILYAMGITQHTHGTDNVLAIANLSMLTGNIGKQNNVEFFLRMPGTRNHAQRDLRQRNPCPRNSFIKI
jgi:anaerobic selenocysteine-containing dehydrogenase